MSPSVERSTDISASWPERDRRVLTNYGPKVEFRKSGGNVP